MKKVIALLVALMPLLTSCFFDPEYGSPIEGTWIIDSITNIRTDEVVEQDGKHTITFRKVTTDEMFIDEGKFTEVKGSEKLKGTYKLSGQSRILKLNYNNGGVLELSRDLPIGFDTQGFTISSSFFDYHFVRK